LGLGELTVDGLTASYSSHSGVILSVMLTAVTALVWSAAPVDLGTMSTAAFMGVLLLLLQFRTLLLGVEACCCSDDRC